MSTSESVTFERVSKRFGTVTAVDGISFIIPKGQLVTLLGPSGCGKTTTLRMIAGLDSVSDGRVLIGNKDVTRLPASQRDVSMVFQSYALFPHLSILDNVAYGLLASGTRKEAAHTQARQKMDLLGLTHLEARLPSELSGGQQQRVAVARALVLEPQVLLFDEPLSNLDAKLRRQVRTDIRELQQKLGLTVVYVTHDQAEALAVSDQVIVMSQARIAQIGTPRELYEHPVSEFLADFIGDTNLLRGSLQRDGEVLVFTAGALRVEMAATACGVPGAVTGPALLAIRPQRMTLCRASAPTTATTNVSIPGVLRKSAYLGTHQEHQVTTPHGELLIMDERVHLEWTSGEPVRMDFNAAAASLIPGDHSGLIRQ